MSRTKDDGRVLFILRSVDEPVSSPTDFRRLALKEISARL